MQDQIKRNNLKHWEEQAILYYGFIACFLVTKHEHMFPQRKAHTYRNIFSLFHQLKNKAKQKKEIYWIYTKYLGQLWLHMPGIPAIWGDEEEGSWVGDKTGLKDKQINRSENIG